MAAVAVMFLGEKGSSGLNKRVGERHACFLFTKQTGSNSDMVQNSGLVIPTKTISQEPMYDSDGSQTSVSLGFSDARAHWRHHQNDVQLVGSGGPSPQAEKDQMSVGLSLQWENSTSNV